MPSTTHAPLRLPEALRKNRGSPLDRERVHALMRQSGLHTVCEEARCPNIGECFQSGTATFMILGDTCTRRCHFCAVTTGKPRPIDVDEPHKLAEAAAALNLQHVVITSVDRDELPDFGAAHFAACIRAVKARLPQATVEILTPDFQGNEAAVDVVLEAAPDVFNHNMETVARLYKSVRPQSNWTTTTGLLRMLAAKGHPAVKSGIMVGLGESDDEVFATLDTMRELGVHIATIGQYLRPSLKHWEVSRYVDDDTYARYVEHGTRLGFTHVFAGAFVRSSYHAKEAHRAHIAHGDETPAARATNRLRVLP
jgi:lipoic acid synthetase